MKGIIQPSLLVEFYLIVDLDLNCGNSMGCPSEMFNVFSGGNAPGMQEQQQMMQMQEDEQMARDMEALEADIIMVNELFTTLATYVHDQGEIVDSIEANTEAAYVQVS